MLRRLGCGFLILLILISIFAYLSRETLLTQAGRFMAPDGDHTAAVAIMEGNEFIDRNVVKRGIDLLSAGKVKRIVVVLHRIVPAHRPFAFNEDYPGRVKQELEAMGISERAFKIIVTPIRHPVTLTAATGALQALSEEQVQSAILLSQGFHTRRSYLAYRQAGRPHRIAIFPSACFNAYPLEKWWLHARGLQDFATESLKLLSYWAMGYIPLQAD